MDWESGKGFHKTEGLDPTGFYHSFKFDKMLYNLLLHKLFVSGVKYEENIFFNVGVYVLYFNKPHLFER